MTSTSMRWLKICCLPILIALALALSVNAQSLSPRPEQGAEPTKHREFVQNPSKQQPTPFASTDLAHAPVETPTPKQKSDDSQSGSVMLWFIGITTVATALIAWFNWQLVGVTHEMKEATREAAEAARQSAIAAHIALTGDKIPYLFIDQTTVRFSITANQADGKKMR